MIITATAPLTHEPAPLGHKSITKGGTTITQAQDHDRRIGRLEGIAEQLDRRLDDIQRTMSEQFRQVNARMDSIERSIAELRASIRWLIGIQFGIVGLLVSILLKLN